MAELRSRLRNGLVLKIGFVLSFNGERAEKIGKSFAFYPSADGTYIDPNCEGITNRRLLDKNVIWDWANPWGILAKYKSEFEMACERSSLGNFGGNYESIMMRKVLYEVRTYFKENS